MDQRLAAVSAAMAEPDPASLAAGERLRRAFGAEAAAWAVTQAMLRRAAVAKFSRAEEMLFTPHGLEQATREPVARWRASRFAAAGVREVWDLGCGIGSDAMAFAEAGLKVVAIDTDPDAVAAATHNLALVGGEPARLGLAEEAKPPAEAAIFLDPARRTARGRTWRMADFTPRWEFVLEQLASPRFVAVKLGPGVPKELIPHGVQTCWVSDGGDVVEASLWNRGEGYSAVVLPHELRPSGVQLEVAEVGRYVLEPDGAVIRAGLLGEAAPGAWLLDEHVAYLSADEPVDCPFVTCFEVLEVLPFDEKVLRAWVRQHQIGTLEIKKRAFDIDPAKLRQRLKPRGPGAATLLLARTQRGARVLVVRRM